MILFRSHARTAEYDEKYNTFLVSVERIPNIRRKEVSDVFNAPHGMIPFSEVIELYFDDREALESALMSEPGLEAGRFLVEFKGAETVTLFANVLEESYPADRGDAA